MGGYLTGLVVLIEYGLAAAAICGFHGRLGRGSAIRFYGCKVHVAFYIVFIGIHLAGAGEALKVMMVISGLAGDCYFGNGSCFDLGTSILVVYLMWL